MTEKLKRIDALIRSNQYESIILGITTALMTCNYEECRQIFPYYYSKDEPVKHINFDHNLSSEYDHIYIKGDIAVVVVSGGVFCRTKEEVKKLTYFSVPPKTYF